jgi:hypothetical protein
VANRFPSFDDRAEFQRTPARSPGAPPTPRDIFGVPLAAKLPTTSVSLSLDANASQITPVYPDDYTEFLNVQADASFPRIVNIWSEENRAFDTRISWAGGGGIGGRIFITGSGGGLQFCIKAKSLRVEIANWLNRAQRVSVSVEDGTPSQTQELHRVERALGLAAGASDTFDLPPYARYVTVASSSAAQRGGIDVSLFDDDPASMAAFLATDGKIPVGAASAIQIRNTNAGELVSYTLDFELGYK